MHARRIRQDPRPTDRRRIVGAFLSAIVPGLGQAYNRRSRPALFFAIPSLAIVALVVLVVQTTSTTRLAAFLIVPATLSAVLVLNALVAAWRWVAVAHAFADRRHAVGASRRAYGWLLAVSVFVIVPHLVAAIVGLGALDSFSRVFEPGGDPNGPSAPGPSARERTNILLLGVDSARGRSHALTDTLMVVSVDPVGTTVTMVSIPRDLVDVPLGNGDVYAPKINSLVGYATRHPDEFPQGGVRAVADAVGALLDIPIHYYAEIDLGGFVRMVDAVGGVDVTVTRAIEDPNYGGFGVGPGWSIAPGDHHFDGANALAYVRIRKSAGESDFTRAERQQQVLVAMRDAAVAGGGVLFELPRLIAAVGDAVRTDLPPERLPELAAIAEEVPDEDIVRIVIKRPLVKPERTRYGSSQIPQLEAIREMAAAAFPRPGVPPTPWPTPTPTAAPASASPAP